MATDVQANIELILDTAGRHNVPLKRSLQKGPSLSLYGPYFEAMVNQVANHILVGEVPNPVQTAGALAIAAELYRRANLRNDGQSWPTKDLEVHQYNVLNGNITVRPDRTQWATVKEGIRQVRTANRLMQGLPDGVESEIARRNYGGCFFGKGTMAAASRTLARKDLNELVASEDQYAMPHLSIGNYVLGQTLASVCDYLKKHKDINLRVYDYGAGHGATSAAGIHSIVSEDVLLDPSRVAYTAIETTPPFYDELKEFANGEDGARLLGLQIVEATEGSNDFSNFGAFTTLFGDAPAAFKRLNHANDGTKKSIHFVNANYVNHRIPSDKQKDIIQSFAGEENVIFAFTDLMYNISIVNRGFFDLGANGPLNTGTENLRKILEEAGYTLIDLSVEKPKLLNDSLHKRTVIDDVQQDRDGHTWIAVRGQLAMESLGLTPRTFELDSDFELAR